MAETEPVLAREIGHDRADALAEAWAAAPRMAWLDSAATGARGRYSYLCVDPFAWMEARGNRVVLDGAPVPGPPWAALRRQLRRFSLPPGAAPTPFAGGAVGFLGYELGGCEPGGGEPPAWPDLCFGFYDLLIAFDHRERRGWVLSSGFPEPDPVRRAVRAAARIEQALHPPAAPPPAPQVAAAWRADWTRAGYEARARRILEYLRAGDVYQANLTMRFTAPRPPGLDPAALYQRLRAASPAPFAALLRCGPDLALAGASPERFLRLDPAGNLETRPIKGTRPRGATPAEDRALHAALAASDKDRAENLMIADLLRHDLGRVARTGSVSVPALCAVESFASVHHLVSEVRARLRPGLDALDALEAAFPGGSITGAPKRRAMQVIRELEAGPRGPYCGAIGWLGFDGAMDTAITIRTIAIDAERLVAQAGGGIVADSDPAAEYAELLVKAGPLLRAADPGFDPACIG